MFFKNYLIFIFVRFLILGLYFGLARIPCKWAVRLSKNNVYVHNLVEFAFWLAFGGVFALCSVLLYNYTFCWFGLLAMFLGLILVKISIDFFFTNLILLLYNKFTVRKKRKRNNGELRAS